MEATLAIGGPSSSAGLPASADNAFPAVLQHGRVSPSDKDRLSSSQRLSSAHTRAAAASLATETDDGTQGSSSSELLTKLPIREDIDSLSHAQLRRLLREALAEVDEKNRHTARMQKTIRELAERLSSVTEFISMRDHLEEHLQSMRAAHQAEVERYRAEAKEARLQTLESRVHLRAVEGEVRRAHAEDVDRRAEELLESRVHYVTERNVELSKDVVLLSKDAESVRAKASTLAQDNATMRRQVELVASMEAELLSRSVAQKKEIAALRRQIKESEDSFGKLVSEYDERFAAQEQSFARRLAAVTRERDDARRDAVRLQAEQKRLRSAASRLVKQRGELEEFFHSALADVRARVLEERRQQLLLTTSAGGAAGAPPPLAVTAASTVSAALRNDSQRHRLQLMEGRSTLISSAFHNPANTRRRLWGTNSKGMPVLLDASKVSTKALPPIPGSHQGKGGRASSGGAGGDGSGSYSMRDTGSSDAWLTGEDETAADAVLYEAGASGWDSPATLPDAPTWREARQVDIKDLHWADKERVIRLLFKRLQQQQQQRGTRVVASGQQQERDRADSERSSAELENCQPPTRANFDDEDDDAFLTQQ